MVLWFDVFVLLEGALALLLGVLLIGRGLSHAGRWVLGGLLFTFGLVTIFLQEPLILGKPPTKEIAYGTVVAKTLFLSLNLAFAVVYPDLTLRPRKRVWLFLSLLPSLVFLFLILPNPDLVATTGSTPPPLVQLLNFLLLLSQLPALWVFTQHWLTTEPSAYRNQWFLVLLPYLFLNVTDAVWALARAFARPEEVGLVLVGFVLAVAFLQLLTLAVLGVGTIVRASAQRRDLTKPDYILLGALALSVPFAMLQFVDVHAGPLFVDGLVAPLLFYGGARFQIVDLDAKVKASLRLGIVGGFVSVVAFFVEQIVQYYTQGSLQLAGSILVAALVVLTFFPLRRAAERAATRIIPGLQASPDEVRRRRRVELYRVALEGMIRDRVIDAREAEALADLRDELGISLGQHKAIEGELRRGWTTPAAGKAIPAVGG